MFTFNWIGNSGVKGQEIIINLINSSKIVRHFLKN